MTKEETLKLALEALETLKRQEFAYKTPSDVLDCLNSITAIKEALAQSEPVKISHKHEWFRTGEMKIGQMRCINCGTWGQEETPQPYQEPVAAAKKDAVFSASIEFIGILTGMKPPPIEIAPPEILKPFQDFTEKVCSIFAAPQPAQQEPVAWGDLQKEAQQIVESKFLWKKFIDGTPLANDIACWMADFARQYTTPPQRTWVGLTDEEKHEIRYSHMTSAEFIEFIEAKLKDKNL